MALRLLDATAIINRTSGLVAASSDYCCCFWYQPGFVSTAPAYIAPLAITDAGYAAWAGIFGDASVSDGGTEVNASDGVTPAGTANHAIAANRKIHLGYRRSGTSHFFYVNGLLVGSATKNIAAVTFAELLLGNDRFSVVSSPLVFWDFKEWSASKSVTTLKREMGLIGSVADTTSLHCYCPLVDDLNDDSGNARHLGGAGNYDFVAQPSLPSNLHPTTALALPFNLTPTTTQQALDASAVSMPVYYKFVNTTGRDLVISLGHWGDLAPGYRPHCDGYVTEDLFNSNIYDGFIEGSGTFPLPAGFTMWFEFKDDDALNTPAVAATLNIKTLRGPEGGGKAGDPTIRSASFGGGPDIEEWAEYTGLHNGFVDAAGSAYRGYIPFFITGETGDVFPVSGKHIYADEGGSLDGFTTDGGLFAYWFYVFQPDMVTQVGRAAVASPLVPPINRMHLPSKKSYNLGRFSGGVIKYSTIDESAVKSADVTVVGATGIPTALAVNNAATIMYLALSGVIKRYDLINNVFLSDLAAAVASHSVTDLLVLGDDSIVASYFKSTITRASFVRRYDTGGSILNTYSPTYSATLTSIDPRLGYSWDATPAFWFFNHLTTAYSDVRKFRVSDGVELVASLTPDVQQSDNQQADPPLPYASDSCPIVELLFDVDEPGGGNGGGGGPVCVTSPPTVPCVLPGSPTAPCAVGGDPQTGGCVEPHDVNDLQIGLIGDYIQ